MARNLELKVKCGEHDLVVIHERGVAIGAGDFLEMVQIDTYFAVASGRLKLREIESTTGDRAAELIAYGRADQSASRWSDYQRVSLPTHQSAAIKAALETACGVNAVVRKRRSAGAWRNTRIHLDRVDGLGCFVELETVADSEAADAEVHDEHEQAILKLGLSGMPTVPGSYGDLIEPSRTMARVQCREKGNEA